MQLSELPDISLPSGLTSSFIGMLAQARPSTTPVNPTPPEAPEASDSDHVDSV